MPLSVAAQTPRSVTSAVTRREGVTSKPKFRAGDPSGTSRTFEIEPSAASPLICVTSEGSRSSIGMSDTPSLIRQSMVELGKRDIEGNAIVMRRERLQISADLVAYVAGARGAVAADDAEIDQTVLHQMAAGVVRDHSMRDSFARKLKGGETRALIPRTRFIDPDMNANAFPDGFVDWRERRSPIDRT